MVVIGPTARKGRDSSAAKREIETVWRGAVRVSFRFVLEGGREKGGSGCLGPRWGGFGEKGA